MKNVVVGLLVSLMLLGAVNAFAQGDGRFSGAVLDSSGAFVPGATVVIKNERTGEERSVVSNAEGRWVVSGLRPSNYTISVKFEQFAPLEYPGMQLVAGQDFAIDLTLQPAGFTEQVTVQAQSTVIDLSSASIGVNVSEREVLNLPVNGRQMSQLMLQSPGSQNAGSGTWNDVRFSGRANQQNVIKFDGVEGSAIIDASPGNIAGQIASPFKLQASLENVQEFRVESNNYPAEYGTGTGGQVTVITKSGGNAIRGSVFEYYRNDALDAPNYFDSSRRNDGTVIEDLGKSELAQNQFGGSFGGPIARDKAFFFVSYEGYRLDAGVNAVEAAPSAAAWGRAVPAIAALRPAFTSPDAVLLSGVSTSPDFDIYQLQALETVRENSFSVRIDNRFSQNWSSYFRVFHDRGTQLRPEGVSGRVVDVKNNPTNLIFNLQGIFGNDLQNEFKLGYNNPYANIIGDMPSAGGIDLSDAAITLTGSVTNTGIAGQSGSTGIVVPGGLVRANSATNGHQLYYKPFSLAFSDAVTAVRGNHLVKIGGDVRLIRMTFDQRGGTTYAFPNLDAFLANQPNQVQYAGDLSAPSVFNNGATGDRVTNQQYFVAYAQDKWNVGNHLTLNYGLRYDYYTPLKVQDDRYVKFNLATGQIDPPGTPLITTKKNSLQPRVSLTYSPGRTVFRTGFGMFVGPGQGEDLIQPLESDRVNTSLSGVTYPANQAALVTNFTNNPNNRAYQPRAYAPEYNIPERVFQYTASVQQELGRGLGVTAAYVGSQGRNLFLRSVGNQVVGLIQPAGTVIREYDVVTCANGNVQDGRQAANTPSTICPGSSPLSKQSPYAEIDFKTSGGRDNYNALMVSLNRRSSRNVSFNLQYTLGRSYGTSGGSNEANTAGNNARTEDEFDYELGFNNFDIRHTFSASLLYPLPFGNGPVSGGWEVGGIVTARSGLPVNVLVTRPDVLFQDTASGLYYSSAAAGRVAVINTPGGGASRSSRRPDLVAGVDPYVKDGGRVFLNPAAFAAPLPGEWGNLERNSIKGPGFQQLDVFLSKRFGLANRNLEFRAEIFNLFNAVNFSSPVNVLPAAVPANPGAANTVQPGQPYTAAAAGSFGTLGSTVSRTVGLGTARQVQFAVRFSF